MLIIAATAMTRCVDNLAVVIHVMNTAKVRIRMID
jgi:hypothetical protein